MRKNIAHARASEHMHLRQSARMSSKAHYASVSTDYSSHIKTQEYVLLFTAFYLNSYDKKRFVYLVIA